MEIVKRTRRTIVPCSEKQLIQDVPDELIQYIQSLLPVKDAVRTSVLSKSWLHAWSTISTLRFSPSKLNEIDYTNLINRTVQRYFRDNIPIIRFELHLENIHEPKSIDTCVRRVASKTCLRELYLKLFVASSSYTLPDETFSGENLNTISVKGDIMKPNSLLIKTVIIKCVNLRVLELLNVHLTEDLLSHLFSTCTFLEKINLSLTNDFKTIQVKNLRFLHELKIAPRKRNAILEISNVPSLHFFVYDMISIVLPTPLSFHTDSLASVRKLSLVEVTVNDTFSNIINSNFPFLEILWLEIESCTRNILDITSASLQTLRIIWGKNIQIDIQVDAPKLLLFRYNGQTIPRLSIPSNVLPDQIVLKLAPLDPFNLSSFFLQLRETLELPTNFKIRITGRSIFFLMAFNIDHVRRRFPFPATNVRKLSFETRLMGEISPFLNAVFSVCHPSYVKAYNGLTMDRVIRIANWMIEKKTRPELKEVEIKDPLHDNWETLTSSWTRLWEGTTRIDWYYVKLRLTWCSAP